MTIDRIFFRLFLIACTIGLIWLLILLQPVVIPLFIALVFAYLLNPFVDSFCHWKFPRGISIVCVSLGITIIFSLTLWYIIPIIWKQMVFIRDNIPVAVEWINNILLPWYAKTFHTKRMMLDTTQITSVIMNYIQTNYSADNIQSFALQIARSSLNILQIGGTAILIPILTFYLLFDWHKMQRHFLSLIPPRFSAKTQQIIHECDHVLKAFIKGQLLVMFLLGAIYALGLELIGLEIGLIIGMIAGLASIIPYAGFAIGIIAAILASLFQFGFDWVHLILVGIVFMVGQLCEGYILQPFLLGDKIGLSPVAVILSVLVGAQLMGFIGMLIALPMAAIIVVLLKHLTEYYQHSDWFTKTTIQVSHVDDIILTSQEIILENSSNNAMNETSNNDTMQTDQEYDNNSSKSIKEINRL